MLTDIAHSSRLAEQYPREYLEALAQHNQLVEEAAERRGGLAYKQVGDGYFALFESAGACLGAAAELGAAFGQFEPLGEDAPVRVRIALHAGTLQPSGKEYFGPALNRVSRICQVCNPGQVLISNALAVLVVSEGGSIRKSVLPDPKDASLGLKLRDLGMQQLRDLAEPEQLYQLDSERFALHDFPPLATLDSKPNNLVRQPNHFIGREKKLAELKELLQGDTQLLSIVAPGGYGKSRLAAQLCADLLHRFENGVFMVYLAPVRDCVDVPSALANALGYQFTAGRTPEQQLCDYLRGKELLLCLDNMEHLLGSAPLVAEILKAAPQVKVLTTSREPLRIKGEQTYVLEPLLLKAGAGEFSEAELLFADRAALVNRSFALTQENGPEVRHFCGHMSGIPLAIEMAAAWMDSFTLKELHDELTDQMELEARTSDQEPRHQSLKASLDWSWNLLGEQQQENLMRLSAFRGGFFSEAASVVLGMQGMALRAVLSRLCDKSWLYTREVDNQTRFFLRDMLAHEYAFARLEETRGTDDSLFEQAVGAHAAYYSALVEREGPRLTGDGTPTGYSDAMHRFRLELENILEALDTLQRRIGADEAATLLLPIAHWLQTYLTRASEYRLQSERYQGLKEAAGRSAGREQLLLWALLGCSGGLNRLGAYDAAREEASEARVLANALGDRHGSAASLYHLGFAEMLQGNYGVARELLSESLAIAREIGDHFGVAITLSNLGFTDDRQGNYSAARELYGESLAIRREMGDLPGITGVLRNLGIVEMMQGNFNAARELFSESLANSREIGDRSGIAVSLGNLAIVEQWQGNNSAARELCSESLALKREIGDRNGEAGDLLNLANIVCIAFGDLDQATEFAEQGRALAREIGNRNREANGIHALGFIALTRGELGLGLAYFTQSLDIMREIGDRYGIAGGLHALGTVEDCRGNYSAAQKLYGEALTIYREIGNKHSVLGISACCAKLFAAQGRLRPAVVVYYGAAHQAAAIGLHFDPDEMKMFEEARARFDSAIANGEMSAEQLAAWKAEGEALSVDALAEFMQVELGRLEVDQDGQRSSK